MEADFMDSRNFDKVFWKKLGKKKQQERGTTNKIVVCFDGIITSIIERLSIHFLFYYSHYSTVEPRFRERGQRAC